MFCDRCGAKPARSRQFSVSLRQTVRRRPAAALPPVNRVNGHLRNVRILWLVYSALRLLPGLFCKLVLDWGIPFMGNVPYFVHGVVRMVGSIFLMMGVLGLIAGWGCTSAARGPASWPSCWLSSAWYICVRHRHRRLHAVGALARFVGSRVPARGARLGTASCGFAHAAACLTFGIVARPSASGVSSKFHGW